MKVTITTKKDLQNPQLELRISLEKGDAEIVLTYLCPKCSGYGCHDFRCDNKIKLNPEDVISTLGEEVRPILEKILGTILKN